MSFVLYPGEYCHESNTWPFRVKYFIRIGLASRVIHYEYQFPYRFVGKICPIHLSSHMDNNCFRRWPQIFIAIHGSNNISVLFSRFASGVKVEFFL